MNTTTVDFVRCQQLTKPYNGNCQCRAVTTCRKCKKNICFDHSNYHDSWEVVCLDCYKEINSKL